MRALHVQCTMYVEEGSTEAENRAGKVRSCHKSTIEYDHGENIQFQALVIRLLLLVPVATVEVLKTRAPPTTILHGPLLIMWLGHDNRVS